MSNMIIKRSVVQTDLIRSQHLLMQHKSPARTIITHHMSYMLRLLLPRRKILITLKSLGFILSTFYTFALSHSRRHHGNKYFVLFSICKTLSPRNVAKNILTTTPVVCVYKHIYHLIIMMNLLTRLSSRRLRSL